jgi:ribonucleoside-diphosphate reductase beta chain
MSSLLDLAQQGDPGTMQESKLSQVKLLTPRELYFQWEKQQWASAEIDFTKDRRDWEGLDEEQRSTLIWNLSSFFVGEERVTTAFSPVVLSAEDEQEEAYLATQQVDEARHMQFFDRFWTEVFGDEADTTRERLHEVRANCNDAFVKLFDERLMEAVDRLRQDPRDIDAKVEAITIYHMVVEGTLALTGQNFITEYLSENGLLPGFVEGFQNVARDEHRHVAYGTWFLQQKCQSDQRYVKIVQDTLQELLPVAAGVLTPPGYDISDEYEILGYSNEQVNQFAFTALSRRLKVIGIGMPGVAA